MTFKLGKPVMVQFPHDEVAILVDEIQDFCIVVFRRKREWKVSLVDAEDVRSLTKQEQKNIAGLSRIRRDASRWWMIARDHVYDDIANLLEFGGGFGNE